MECSGDSGASEDYGEFEEFAESEGTKEPDELVQPEVQVAEYVQLASELTIWVVGDRLAIRVRSFRTIHRGAMTPHCLERGEVFSVSAAIRGADGIQ